MAERYVVVVRYRELPGSLRSEFVPRSRRRAEGMDTAQEYKLFSTRLADVALVAVGAGTPFPNSWQLVETATLLARSSTCVPGAVPLPRVARTWTGLDVGRTQRSPHRRVIREAQAQADVWNADPPPPPNPAALSAAAAALASWLPDPQEALLAAHAALSAAHSSLRDAAP